MKKIVINIVSESEFSIKGHGVHTAFVEMVNALKDRADVEIVVNQKRTDVEVTHIHTVGSFALMRLLRGKSKKVVSAHIVPGSLVGSLTGAKWWLPIAKAYLRWFYNRADLLFAVSEETERQLTQMGVTTPTKVVHNFIDTDQYKTTDEQRQSARRTLGFTDSDWVVVGAGQIQPRKRVDSFVEAAKQLPDMTFMWVGGMPFGKVAADHTSMQAMINKAPSNVRFTGIVDLNQMKQFYQAANAFWLPSEQETFGIVVIEAAATGLPIVLRDIKDYDETFRPDALMVPSGHEVEAFTALRNDDTLYKNYQAKAADIADRYSARRAADRIVTIYQELVR